ncbi:MAG: response regulator transcription factor [Limnobacter sp.]|nr:response regulator transcription factor [Limnobacter sp.]
MPRVLHIDDDPELGDLLQQYLQGEGFEAHYCSDPLKGLELIGQLPFDLLILDVMMPEQNGLDTLKALRQTHRLPVLMLTAKGDDIDRIVGLELGADDYVAKPCLPREIVARIRAILRRTSGAAGNEAVSTLPNATLQLGGLVLQADKRKATMNSVMLELTSAEFNILEVLMRNAGQMVSKSILCEQGLGRPLTRYDRAIDVHLSSLRSKLGLNASTDTKADGRAPKPSGLQLHTIRGQGVQLSES